jgi:hypothetical protein
MACLTTYISETAVVLSHFVAMGSGQALGSALCSIVSDPRCRITVPALIQKVIPPSWDLVNLRIGKSYGSETAYDLTERQMAIFEGRARSGSSMQKRSWEDLEAFVCSAFSFLVLVLWPWGPLER